MAEGDTGGRGRLRQMAVGFDLALVLCLQLLLLYPLHRYLDLPRWDEPNYMGLGEAYLSGVRSSLAPLSYSPPYVLLYAGLVRLWGTIGAVFAMKYILTLAVTVALFLFLWRALRARPLALLLSLVWAISTYNLGAETLVYHAALFLFLCALLVVEKSRLCALVLLLLAAFVRLEYLLLLALYLTYLVVAALRGGRLVILPRPGTRTGRRLGLAALVLIGLLVVFIASQLDNWQLGGARGFYAFQQHYALRQVLEGRAELDPVVDYDRIAGRDFPGCRSFAQAMRANPRAFFGHLWRNLPDQPPVLIGLVVPAAFSVARPALVLFAGPLVLLALYLALTGWRGFVGALGEQWSLLAARRALLVGSPAGLLPGLLICPKTQYALVLVPLLFIGFGALLRAAARSDRRGVLGRILGVWTLVALAGLLLVVGVGPRPFSGPPPARPFYQGLQELRAVWPSGRVPLFGVPALAYANYLGSERCAQVLFIPAEYRTPGDTRPITLDEVLAAHHPQAVIVDRHLLESRSFDVASLTLLNSPSWQAHRVGEDWVYLLH